MSILGPVTCWEHRDSKGMDVYSSPASALAGSAPVGVAGSMLLPPNTIGGSSSSSSVKLCLENTGPNDLEGLFKL